MKYHFSSSLAKRSSADALILPFFEGGKAAFLPNPFADLLERILRLEDFKGRNGEVFFVYPEKEKEKRFLLLGLGKEKSVTSETLRKAYAQAVAGLRNLKLKECNVLFPFSSKEEVAAVWEGILLSNYAFNEWKSKEASPLLSKIGIIGIEKEFEPLLARLETVIGSVNFTRDLVNGNADDVTPAFLAKTAIALAKNFPKIKTTVRDKKWLEKEKMGLILAVSRGSKEDPFLIEMSYKGNPGSSEHIVLVGKGVTYDTGGLALKTVEGMCPMKSDMAGSAAVMGAIRACAELKLKVNVSVVIPTVENSIDAKSYKHGDVYRSYLGKTVEINNTDAEGRLILADALSFAVKHLEPTYLIDLATLTGNVVMALGEHMAGFCSNDDKLAQLLLAASSRTSDLLWRLPLHQEYKESFRSDIADLVNSGGRDAGSIKGALFLQEFIGSAKWAHLDIAGSAFWSKPKYYNTTKATGFGVQLLVSFLLHCNEA